MSASELSNHRRIVFESDLAVKSERNSSSSFKRFLCDYHITQDTSFSYSISHVGGLPYGEVVGNQAYDSFLGVSSTVNEPLPSSRVYSSIIPSGGRWQSLSLPAPLYSIEVRARLECYNYATGLHEWKDIPLPAGALYDVKIVFVSKHDPEALHQASAQFRT